MRKILGVTIGLLCVFLLVACGKDTQERWDSEKEKIQIIQDNNKASFFYDKYAYLENLQLTNMETGEKYTICAIPGCVHVGGNCLGDQYNVGFDFSAIYKDHVLFMNTRENALYFVGIDGTNLTRLLTFEDEYQVLEYNKILVDSHLYVFASFQKQVVDNDGYVNNDQGFVRVYDIDMDNESYEILYEGEIAIASYPQSYLLYNEHKLAFAYQNQTKRIEESGISEKDYYANYDAYFEQRYEIQGLEDYIIVMDLLDGGIETLTWNEPGGTITPAGFIGHKLYGYRNDGIYVYDLKNNSKDKILSSADGRSFNVQQSADFVLIWYWTNNANAATYYIIKNDGEEMQSMKKELSSDFIIDDECYSQLHLQYFSGSGDFDESNSEYVDRDDFISWFE